jgi:hypothetical protein
LNSATIFIRELCQGLPANARAADFQDERPLWTMLSGKIVLRLHFDEAARGALKIELQSFAAVELRRRRRG